MGRGMLDFKGKIALVTGCGSIGPGFGNGKATAIQLARQGARIFGVDLNKGAATETKTIIEREGGVCEIVEGTSPIARASSRQSKHVWHASAE
jgi:NAD(P)-dependent dehydrogenase (short-subunit alcohol dehydrogenase family)